MDKKLYTLKENRLVAAGTYRLVLSGPGPVEGEFVHLDIPGYYRRKASPSFTKPWEKEPVPSAPFPWERP